MKSPNHLDNSKTRETSSMLKDFKPKDMSYIIMIIVILMCVIVLAMETVDACFAILCFIVTLMAGLFYLIFFDVD